MTEKACYSVGRGLRRYGDNHFIRQSSSSFTAWQR